MPIPRSSSLIQYELCPAQNAPPLVLSTQLLKDHAVTTDLQQRLRGNESLERAMNEELVNESRKSDERKEKAAAKG